MEHKKCHLRPDGAETTAARWSGRPVTMLIVLAVLVVEMVCHIAPVQAQTVTLILSPGSPAVADTLCARLRAFDVGSFSVHLETGDRLRVEGEAMPSDADDLHEILTAPGVIAFYAVTDGTKISSMQLPQVDAADPPLFVAPVPLMTGDHVARAEIGEGDFGRHLALEMTREGARRLEIVTGRFIGERFAIVVDGIVLSAPTIQQLISGGSAVVYGHAAFDWAPLVAILNGGPIPGGLSVVEQRSGPSAADDVPICTVP